MIKKQTYRFLLILFLLSMIFPLTKIQDCSLHAQSMRGMVLNYFTNYKRNDQYIKSSTLDSIITDKRHKKIKIYASGGFKEQIFTEDVVENIYSEIGKCIPDSLSHYDLNVITDNHEIHDLIPNAIRTSRISKERLPEKYYNGHPWVTASEKPYKANKGLDGVHLALWQSHGAYWANDKNSWKWQRPRLFCTTEDLFSQSFVIPYIIPMLENAGAYVFTPRDRDWQNNEILTDNDNPQTYIETGKWEKTDSAGFASLKQIYAFGENPFKSGTTRMIKTESPHRAAAKAEWVPEIHEDGNYAVYVAYTTLHNSIPDAHYTIVHKGINTSFKVNQQMGGGTWVYLGTFNFEANNPHNNKIILTNASEHNGVVTADAVRLGSGNGNIARSNGTQRIERGNTSGLPRWAEAATYYAQWAGMPEYVYNRYNGANDYNNDLWARPNTINYLSGGSVFMPDTTGLNIPFELAMAFHTDAGFNRDESFIGSLAICSTDYYNGKTRNGQDRYASYDLASLFLNGLQKDMKKYNWQIRQVWNRNYCETRETQIPSTILEMLSHQNYADMRMGYDPRFKFDFSRSVYKSIVKYMAGQHKTDYVIQPLPIHNFAVKLNEEKSCAILSWDETIDNNEPTAEPNGYIVYTRIDHGDFDNGKRFNGKTAVIDMIPGKQYSFKVCAVNHGGISFPSETLSAYIAPNNIGTILIVNAFNRLEGPACVNNDSIQGFDLDKDPGVQYGAFAGFCGRQITYSKKNMGSEATSGTGYSGKELEGQIIMGNTFDYVALHGQGIKEQGIHSYTSCSEEALLKKVPSPNDYKMIDIIFGVEKSAKNETVNLLKEYCAKGGRLLISGATPSYEKWSELGHLALQAPIHEYCIDGIRGCDLSMHLYREMNDKSYAVPYITTMDADEKAFVMMLYSNNAPAAVAYDGTDYKTIMLGFPLESIKEDHARNTLMQAITNFLCK